MRVSTTVIVCLSLVLLQASAHALPCPDPPCLPCGEVVDLRPYFIPSYSGWQTAKRIWTYQGGNSDCFRFFQYSADEYELIKTCPGTATETYRVTSTGIYVTSEMGTPLGSQARLFQGNGLLFLPVSICTNRTTFQVCHEGETFINNASCLTTGSAPAHCANYLSRVEFAPSWNYGGNLGVIDSIIKIDRLDNGQVEMYWFGRGRGILRWEHRTATGTLLNSGQQTSEIPNSPIPHNSCFQP
jgi:hypothetical protein